MALPNNYQHGIIVNDNGVLKQPTSLLVNDNGTIKSPKQAWINSSGSLVKVWPPRAYVVELVPIGGRPRSVFYDVSTKTDVSKPEGWLYNTGSWNRLTNATQIDNQEGYFMVYAFRLWTKFSSQNPLTYDFSGLNRIKRTGATTTGTATSDIASADGGLYPNIPFVSYSDNRYSAPFVVIQPGSKMLCIRARVYKSFSGGSGEGEGGSVSTVAMWSGNSTYWGGSGNPAWGNAIAHDLPGLAPTQQNMLVNAWSDAGGAAPSGGDGRGIVYPPYFLMGYPVCSQHTAGGKSGISTSSSASGALNSEAFFSNPNYAGTYVSSISRYGAGGEGDGLANTQNQSFSSGNTTCSALNSSALAAGHVGWKYFGQLMYDGESTVGTQYANAHLNIGTSGFVNKEAGSTLFLVIPP
jgi:hypothetical protein